MRSSLRLWVGWLCVVSSLALAGPKKGARPKSPPAPPAKAQLSTTLDAAEEKVGACVLEHASGDNWTRVVRVKLSINSAGQLLSSTVSVEPKDASDEVTRKCVDDVFRALEQPKSAAPLTTAEREWTFKVQAP